MKINDLVTMKRNTTSLKLNKNGRLVPTQLKDYKNNKLFKIVGIDLILPAKSKGEMMPIAEIEDIGTLFVSVPQYNNTIVADVETSLIIFTKKELLKHACKLPEKVEKIARRANIVIIISGDVFIIKKDKGNAFNKNLNYSMETFRVHMKFIKDNYENIVIYNMNTKTSIFHKFESVKLG